jgi:putative hydrolase of the HAD superfamily
MPIAAVVFDLDGVVRHWDPAVTERIEATHGLARGAILDAAFSTDLGPAAVTGAITYDDWIVEVGRRTGSPEAATDWSTFRGTVDDVAKAFVAEVRATGTTVGVLSNATTRLREDLDVIGLADSFDHIFNTAELGVCKPDPAVYRQVLDLLSLPGDQVVFTDDLPDWAEAATSVGMHGIPFTGIPALRARLRALGVDV